FLPAAAFVAVSAVIAGRYRNDVQWRTTFLAAACVFGIVALDALISHQHRRNEEAFVTALPPMTLALVGGLAVAASIYSTNRAAWAGRWWKHWAGILACFVPLGWFLHWQSKGLVEWHGLFVRMID